MKLDLGCGGNTREGYTGIDIDPACHPDIVMDLDTESLVARFGENTVEAIYSNHFLEHSRDLIRLITEMWQVSRRGSFWEIHVPPAECEFGNPFHHFRFTEWTFRFFEVTGRFVHQPSGWTISYGITDSLCPVRLREIEQHKAPYDLRFLLEVVK